MEPAAQRRAPTVAVFLDDWLVHVKGRVRQKTWMGYEGQIRNYAKPHLGEVRISDLEALDIQGLYSELLGRTPALSGGTVLNLHSVLTQAFGQAVRWGYLSVSPVSGTQPPRARRKEPLIIDEKATATILEAAKGTRLEAPVAIAIATGMRRGEILGLRWSDMDDDWTLLRVRRSLQTADGLRFEDPKTRRSRRTVALPEFLRTYLQRQQEDQLRRRNKLGKRWKENDLVIDKGDGSPLNPDTMSSSWWYFCRAHGLPKIRFHDLRHAHATLMLLQGVHPKIVSERLGHASIGITLDTYSHVLPTMQEDAVRAFDALFTPEDRAVDDPEADLTPSGQETLFPD
jgi:integrase